MLGRGVRRLIWRIKLEEATEAYDNEVEIEHVTSIKHVPPNEHLYFISERTFLTMLDTSHLIKLELVNDQIRNPEKTINSAHRQLQTKENEITSKRTMLAMDTRKAAYKTRWPPTYKSAEI